MELLACGHAAYEGPFRVCLHLAVEEYDNDVVRVYTGRGLAYDLLCATCAALDDPGSQLAVVCEGCSERAAEMTATGVRGTPEVRRRDVPVGGALHETALALTPANGRCLAPLPDGWLVYTTDGLTVVRLDAATYGLDLPSEEVAAATATYQLVMPDEEAPANSTFGVYGPTVHTSYDGRFAAVVMDHGRYGAVVDLAAGGAVTLGLDRGEGHNYTTPFPLAFTEHQGEVIAGTDWNRLDRFDAATGRLLTERDTSWAKGEARPEEYLDYFHGRLTVNRTGTWCVDDGWVWHPVGVPLMIDLAAWREGDTYAAERGRSLAHREYAWNQPVAWVDDTTVAIQRIGDDDLAMVDGVQLYDAPTAQRVGAFAGPKGEMWSVDGRLAVAADAGLEFWDPADGIRTGLVSAFHPTAYNPHTKTFASLADGTLRTYRLP